MLDKIGTLNKTNRPQLTVVDMEPIIRNDDRNDTLSEAEIRRQMYERIARGNALAEVEENARREWRR